MQSNLVQTNFKTGHIFKRSRKTAQYNEYSKQFQIFNQKSLQKTICFKILQEKRSNNLLNIIFTQKLGKATYTERKKAESFLIIRKNVFFFSIQILWNKNCFLFFYYSNCLKVISLIHVCLRIQTYMYVYFWSEPIEDILNTMIYYIRWMCIKFSKKNIRKLSELQIKFQFQKCCSWNIWNMSPWYYEITKIWRGKIC